MPSICSAHVDVIEASLRLAIDLDRPLLIEATSNQVNQFGGYTGLVPTEFRELVLGIATTVGFDPVHLHLGGDHLGPQAWKAEPAREAMKKAAAMMRAYVRAGFTKIHLDCSEGCAGELEHLPDEIAAARAAQLAIVCEKAAPDPEALSYIVGTEVPSPGGARVGKDMSISLTDYEAAKATLAAHQAAFVAHGIGHAWVRVVGLVVQPGLEFGADFIDHFCLDKEDRLSQALIEHDQIAFEAHSTDYQHKDVYPELARRHFAILKVGPALTFAWREALYSLDHIRTWIDPSAERLHNIMEALMQSDPGYWKSHYDANTDQARVLRSFGYADRIRYYWSQPKAKEAVEALLSAIDGQSLPDPLLNQYFDEQTVARSMRLQAAGLQPSRALLLSKVQQALRPYFFKKAIS